MTLTPGSGAAGQVFPADMRALEGQLTGGGMELVGLRPLPGEAAIGGPLKLGLLWRALRDGPQAEQFTVRLVRDNGEVAQETVLPLFGGRVAPSVLRAGNVVRDEQTLIISPRVPSEPLSVEVSVMDGRARLGGIKMTGRVHTIDRSATAQATFGRAVELLDSRLEPAAAKGGEKVTVKLGWRAAADMAVAYKVFVHVLEPTGLQVVTQRDAEPQDGRAPTTGWVVGEVLDDEYVVTLPPNTAAGSYSVEIGIYDPKNGDRLTLAGGDNHLILPTVLTVR
jgi:hypothetical protein